MEGVISLVDGFKASTTVSVQTGPKIIEDLKQRENQKSVFHEAMKKVARRLQQFELKWFVIRTSGVEE